MQPTPKDVKWMDESEMSWHELIDLALDAEIRFWCLRDRSAREVRAFGDYLNTLGERLRESVPLTEGDLDVIAVHVGATFGGRFTEVRPHVKHGQTDLAGWNPDALAIIHIESVHPGAMGPGGSVYGLPASMVLRDLVARLNKHMYFSSPVGIERTNPAVLSVVAL